MSSTADNAIAIATGSTRRRIGWVALLIALCAWPLLVHSYFYVHIANLVFLNIMLVIGLGIILKAGQLSLCHAAFAGIGAYVSALLAIHLKLPPLLGVLAGGVIAGVVALLIGTLILRLRGVYFVLVTFLFGQLFNLLVLDAADVTGGANGVVGIPIIRLFGISFGSPLNFYYLALTVAVLLCVFAWALLRSPTGRAFAATDENIALAEASGIDTRNYQLLAFTLGSAIAGIGGGLMGHYLRFISPDTFTFWESVTSIVMVIIGGRASLGGWIIGAAFLTPLPEVLREAKDFQHVLFGIILIVVLMFLPRGLIALWPLALQTIRRLFATRHDPARRDGAQL